ncbi:uncharacterized protein EV154DRAFT_451416 [Mucor mucedo]|uniref:uncharacterized protein n=1 Tax=Mucor mucedo TaxID=29922 RepID=UPI00221F8D30|nr:uncharacterized protein EV154DRAFT_451416 [Mucor mucedo]KAI7876640.1 hypothetical protein EV154DRAFT_451416 [Mucor mucedo]
MTFKFELEQWQAACVAFDNNDYDTSVKTFIGIADNAKMHFNIGLIFATVEDHDHALGAYTKAISMDPYFAVAYFQRGVSQFIKNNMEAAKDDFDQAYQKLRGNQIINYQQLGLSFRLYSCEVLFNRGICQLYLGKMDAGLTDLYHAQKARMTEEHDVIDLAVKDRGKGYSVFSIPPLVLFRPPENRLKQLKGLDMFAVVDQLQIKKPQTPTYIKRNNSILLSEKVMVKKQNQQSPLRTSSPRQPPQQQQVDSGFESTLEDRYSSSSSLAPPVPPIPKQHNEEEYYGDFDQELDEVYGSLHDLSVQDKERDIIRHRLASGGNKEDLRIQTSTSTSTIGSNNSGHSGKIKIKIHYVDTRILMVPNAISFDELKFRVRDKFGAPPSIRLQYKDEDNEMVLMIDDDDLFMARQVNRSSSDVEKMEIWCVDS